MKNKIMNDYIVIKKASFAEFVADVKKYLSAGFELYGSLIYQDGIFVRELVRYK